VTDSANDQCLRFLANMAMEYAATLSPTVQETLVLRIKASHTHLVRALTPQEAAPPAQVGNGGDPT
jgi:hypothetical protein